MRPKSWCLSPANMTLQSNSNHGVFHQPTQYETAVKLKLWCLSPANILIWHCCQTEIMVSFASQCSMTWQSNWNHGVFHQPTHHDIAVRRKSWCLSPVNAAWHGSQTKGFWDCSYGRCGSELNMEPSTQSLPGIRLSRTTVVLSWGRGGAQHEFSLGKQFWLGQ